jgi:SAM-dependent methyltransferase
LKSFSQVPLRAVEAYWNRRPCNIRHSQSPIGTKTYFDEVEARRYFVEPHIPDFAQFERWKGKKVLEIGCGIGTDTVRFARSGAEVTAVEVSSASLDLARERSRLYGLERRIKFYLGDAENLSAFLPREPYDLVYCFGVIHHTPHPENILKEIRGYVHPHSVVKLMVYHRFSWKVLWILFVYGKCRFWKLKEWVARYSEAEEGCPVTYTFTRRQIKKLVETHGFCPATISTDHIFPYKIPDYVQYRYSKVWYFRWMPAPFFRWLEKRFGWHLCVTASPC